MDGKLYTGDLVTPDQQQNGSGSNGFGRGHGRGRGFGQGRGRGQGWGQGQSWGHDQSLGNMQAGGNAQSQGIERANRFDVLLDEGESQLDAEVKVRIRTAGESEIKILSWNVERLNSEKKGN